MSTFQFIHMTPFPSIIHSTDSREFSSQQGLLPSRPLLDRHPTRHLRRLPARHRRGSPPGRPHHQSPSQPRGRHGQASQPRRYAIPRRRGRCRACAAADHGRAGPVTVADAAAGAELAACSDGACRCCCGHGWSWSQRDGQRNLSGRSNNGRESRAACPPERTLGPKHGEESQGTQQAECRFSGPRRRHENVSSLLFLRRRRSGRRGGGDGIRHGLASRHARELEQQWRELESREFGGEGGRVCQ